MVKLLCHYIFYESTTSGRYHVKSYALKHTLCAPRDKTVLLYAIKAIAKFTNHILISLSIRGMQGLVRRPTVENGSTQKSCYIVRRQQIIILKGTIFIKNTINIVKELIFFCHRLTACSILLHDSTRTSIVVMPQNVSFILF